VGAAASVAIKIPHLQQMLARSCCLKKSALELFIRGIARPD
jgi:hypothetical protein